MKKILIGSLFTLVIFTTLLISTCAAAPDDQQTGGAHYADHMKDTLANLSAKGYDVSQIQAAIDKGDNQGAFKLLNDLYDQHPEVRPPMSIDRIKQTVTNLTAKGFDVSQIQAAIDGGDAGKATSALNDFWKEHPDARPAPRAQANTS